MKFFKRLLFFIFLIICFVYCTKNSVATGITPTSIQIFNYYYSTNNTTFSLIQGKDTVLSKVAYNDTSRTASGAPGFYSLSFENNANDTILSGNINLQAGTKYSMFIVDDTTQNSNAVRYTLVTNNTTDHIPLYDSCRIRILDFAGGINNTTMRFLINQGVGFGFYSPFFTRNPATIGRTYLDNILSPSLAQYFTAPAISYKIKFQNGSDTTENIMDSMYYSFLPQKQYTLLLLGQYDSTGNKVANPFNLKIITQ